MEITDHDNLSWVTPWSPQTQAKEPAMNRASPRGVIVISLDAIRADHLSHYGYDRQTSPFLDSLATENVVYQNAFSASSHTREAVPAMLTGNDPIFFAQEGFKLCRESIAARLERNGFMTGAFHSNPYLSRAYGFDEGFSKFNDDLLLGKNRLLALAQTALNKFILKTGDYQARASQINSRSINWLDSLDHESTFFLWNHYMDAHGPYNPPDGYCDFTGQHLSDSETQKLYHKAVKRPDSITDEEQQLLIDLYDGEITYLDARLREFFTQLKRRDLLEESVVIITSDHGDGFGRHGFYGHPRLLYNELLHVPLIIVDPCSTEFTVDRPVTTLNIAPTVYGYIDLPHRDLPGHPLRPAIDSKSAENLPIFSSVQGENVKSNIRSFAAQTDRYKVILDRDIRSNELVKVVGFDLQNDPREDEPIYGFAHRDMQNLRETLEQYSEERIAGRNDWQFDEGDVTEKIEERLEILGYK